jgi:integrase
VRVRNAVVEAERGHEIGPVKTRQSRRNVEFSGAAAHAMRRHRKRQLEEEVAVPRWGTKNLVFPTTVGTLMTRHLIHKPFKRALRRAELPAHHGFGDLRHTFATLMFARGVHPKIVQEITGTPR